MLYTHKDHGNRMSLSLSSCLSLGFALLLLSCTSQPSSEEGAASYESKLSHAKEAGPAGIEKLAPLLTSSDGNVRRGAIRTVREIAFDATRPGADENRIAASAAIIKLIKTHPDLPDRTRLQLYQDLAVLSPDADSLAGLPVSAGDVMFFTRAVEKGQAMDAYLDELEAQRAEEGSGAVIGKYRSLLASGKPQIRAAALRALTDMGAKDLFLEYLACLDSDNLSLRQIGQAALVEMQEPATSARLQGAWDKASPPVRGGILRVLFRRRDPEALALLHWAARKGSLTERVVALELLGGLSIEDVTPLLQQTLAETDPQIQAAAGAALTQLADRALSDASKQAKVIPAATAAQARALLHPVLERCKGNTELRLAMRVLERCADADSLALARPLLANKVTREEAARVCVAAAKTLEAKHQAKRTLNEIYKLSQSRSTRRSAIDGLETLGVSTGGYARRAGFLNEWYLIGGFQKTSKETLGQHPFGTKGPDPRQPFDRKGKPIAWKSRKTKDPDGIYDLRFLKPSINTAAYAFTTIDWPRTEPLLIKAGSDDSIAIWVNGKLVHDHYIPRGVTPDSDKVPVTFQKGTNRILVKIGQGSGGWGFCIRLATQDGKPIDLTQRRPAH